MASTKREKKEIPIAYQYGRKKMSNIGNRNGPRESEILNKLGPNYFGCSAEDLESDISHHQYAESRGEVVPVHIDEKGALI